MNKDFFKQVRILDGGMGQELHAKGLISMGTLWSASANLEKKFHNLVVDLHLSYINSGADVIITNTFSARRIRLIQNKVNEHFNYINEQACLLAIKARDLSKKNILIAGSLPSQSDTYVEDQRNSNEIEKDFLDQATIINPYVDFFYLDVLSSGKELDIASNVAAKLKRPILAGVHLKKNCLLPSGESITEVVKKYKNENKIIIEQLTAFKRAGASMIVSYHSIDIAKSFLSRKKSKIVICKSKTSDLSHIRIWVEEGKIKPVIEKVYEFDQYREAY